MILWFLCYGAPFGYRTNYLVPLNDKVAKNIFWTGAGGPHLIGNFGEVGCHQTSQSSLWGEDLQPPSKKYFSLLYHSAPFHSLWAGFLHKRTTKSPYFLPLILSGKVQQTLCWLDFCAFRHFVVFWGKLLCLETNCWVLGKKQKILDGYMIAVLLCVVISIGDL